MITTEQKLAAEHEIVRAVLYAMRTGALFVETREPRPNASVNVLKRWGAMRNLHNKVAALTMLPNEPKIT